MKLILAGDTHGSKMQIEYLCQVAIANDVDKIVQLGDYGIGFDPYWNNAVNKRAKAAEIDFYFLRGNHDAPSEIRKLVDVDLMEIQSMDTNLYYLPDGCKWDWDGCTFMSVGGAHSIDQQWRTEGISWWADEEPQRHQVERAIDQGDVDVLLTHDAPEGCVDGIGGPNDRFPDATASRLAISAVFNSCLPEYLYHGHYHRYYKKLFQGCKVTGLDCDGTREKSWEIFDTDQVTRELH